MELAELDWVAETLVDRVRQRRHSPAATLFLLHRYAETADTALRPAIESALTAGLETAVALRDPRERCLWLGVFAEAAAMSDDERLPDAVQRLLAHTVDDLEQFVRASYEPGEGLVGASALEQLRCATALLMAFELTGRLPYSMLAEELLVVGRPREQAEADSQPEGFLSACLAVQLWCRLSQLHRDPEYAAQAVARPHAHYADAARQTLARLSRLSRDHPDQADEYGIALVNWFALNSHPN